MDVYDEIRNLRKDLNQVCMEVAGMKGEASTLNVLIKFVITPLLIILGSLTGINLLR